MIYQNRQEIRSWFEDWTFFRPVFFTGVFNDRLGYGEGEVNADEIRKTNKHFFNELHRRVFKKTNKKIPRLVVIERGRGRKHSHMVLETPEHLSAIQYHHLIQQSWLRTRNGVSIDLTPVYDLHGLSNYLSKEVYPDCEILGVDIQNCHKTI